MSHEACVSMLVCMSSTQSAGVRVVSHTHVRQHRQSNPTGHGSRGRHLAAPGPSRHPRVRGPGRREGPRAPRWLLLLRAVTLVGSLECLSLSLSLSLFLSSSKGQ
jgi:hypothetical protein